jgi:parallel beta-helix repeat protein
VKVFGNESRSKENVMKRVASIILFICLFAISVTARTWRVPSECPTIQEGIDSASSGDIVLVADGIYTGSGNTNLDFLGKSITVTSENGPGATIIDCENDSRGVYFRRGETNSSTFDGFTVRAGSGYNGGGILCSGASPSITNCIISGNTALETGGGIAYYSASYPKIESCVISGNSAVKGGGIMCSYGNLDITNSIVTENSSNLFGGGIYLDDSNLDIANSVLSGNSVNWFGGGVSVIFESSMRAENCIIAGNTAYYGGGIECIASNVTLTNCTLTENVADYRGGGVHSYLYDLTVTNCILWGDEPQEISSSASEMTVTYTDIEGGHEGEGNIDEDPNFIPFPVRGLDYILRPDSPCIDSGDPDILDGLYDWHPQWPNWYPDKARSDMGAYGGPGNTDWMK